MVNIQFHILTSPHFISQCDAVSVLEKEHDYREEHFDFIQSNLRRFCLNCILFGFCISSTIMLCIQYKSKI